MIKITKHEYLKPLQSRLPFKRSCQSNKNAKKIDTSTLGEIVSFEKSNKNIIGLRMKKVVISEDIIREVLQLNDAEGVVCLPNEDIFAVLAQMGYEKPAKRTSWNEFSSAMASAVICLSTDDVAAAAVQEDVAEDVHDAVIPSPTPLTSSPQPSHDIPSTSQVHTSPPQQPHFSPPVQPQGAEFPMHLLQQVLDTCAALTHRVDNLEHDKATQKLEIIKLQARERMIADLDKDEGIELVDEQVKDTPTAKVKGRQTDKQAEIYQLDLDHPFKVLSMQEDDSEVQEAVEVDKGKGILIEKPKPMKKKDQIELDAEYARKLHKEINKDIDWDTAIDHVNKKSKDVRCKYEVSADDEEMEEEDQKALQSINETLAQKATKRRKLNEEAKEVEDLKKHLEVVHDYDDVFTEVTPLARKVPIVDYQIVKINNKPRYKIIKANETH
nr:hypothetical protein [Tanacetum cinerariifolium]